MAQENGNKDLSQIIASAKRLGIELDEEEAFLDGHFHRGPNAQRHRRRVSESIEAPLGRSSIDAAKLHAGAFLAYRCELYNYTIIAQSVFT